MALIKTFRTRSFNFVHRNHLIYNTCWEDPRVDHVALNLGERDTVLMITSAGCNALDYALAGPAHVYAVDMNPRQNALLELKIAAIKRLTYEDFFSLFGRGRLNGYDRIYQSTLRPMLSESAREFWDENTDCFDGQGRRNSFYFRGTSGWFAWLINEYINRVARVREAIDNAWRILRPGGTIGVVDFYVSHKFPSVGMKKHGWWTRTFWPAWFASDNVWLSSDPLRYLLQKFQKVELVESKARVPYMLGMEVPYFIFVGRKPDKN